MSTIEDRVICITGVTAGIGRAAALDFAARGALVVGCGRREPEGRALEEEARAAGGTLTFVRADISEPGQCEDFVEAAVAEHGRVDVLLNNAGGSGRRAIAPFEDIDASDWREVIALNLDGTFACAQAAYRRMIKQPGGGVIINMASVQGLMATRGMAPYCAAKAAVIQLTKTIALEGAAHGVRANAIIMGGAATEAAGEVAMGMAAMATASGNGHGGDYGGTEMTLPEPLLPIAFEDISAALALLASDDARAITGASVAIDRGLSAGALHSAGLWQALQGAWQA